LRRSTHGLDQFHKLVAILDHREIRRQGQNYHQARYYSRPGVTRLAIDRRRQAADFIDEPTGWNHDCERCRVRRDQ
jgi:hypothetical protein